MRGMKRSALGTAAVIVLTFGSAASAVAAETDEVAQLLVEQSLSDLGVEDLSDELAEELELAVLVALDSGVVSEEVAAVAADVVDGIAEPESLGTSVEFNREAQDELWELEAETVREAFSGVSAQFALCQESEEACGDFQARFRERWVIAETARITALEGALESLSGEDREKAQQALQERVQRFEQRVESGPATKGNPNTPDGQEQPSESSPPGRSGESQSNAGQSGQGESSPGQGSQGQGNQGQESQGGGQNTDDSSGSETSGDSSSSGSGSGGQGGKPEDTPGNGSNQGNNGGNSGNSSDNKGNSGRGNGNQ